MQKYTTQQCVIGGRKRAATAKRHPAYGIFLPDVEILDIMYPTTYKHGQAGGRALVEKYGREYMRQLAKKKLKPTS